MLDNTESTGILQYVGKRMLLLYLYVLLHQMNFCKTITLKWVPHQHGISLSISQDCFWGVALITLQAILFLLSTGEGNKLGVIFLQQIRTWVALMCSVFCWKWFFNTWFIGLVKVPRHAKVCEGCLFQRGPAILLLLINGNITMQLGLPAVSLPFPVASKQNLLQIAAEETTHFQFPYSILFHFLPTVFSRYRML